MEILNVQANQTIAKRKDKHYDGRKHHKLSKRLEYGYYIIGKNKIG